MPRRNKPYREIEIKVRVSNVAELIQKLRSLGAKLRGRVLERNTLFDTDASDLRRRRRLLRLRVETPAASHLARAGRAREVLTAKSPVSAAVRGSGRFKVAFEREVVVQEPAPAPPVARRQLRDRGWSFALGCLGLRTSFRYEKYRTSFALAGLELSLDETPVGTFLELEGDPLTIDRVAGELGFAPDDYIRATYYELYAADRRRRGRPVHNMLFAS